MPDFMITDIVVTTQLGKGNASGFKPEFYYALSEDIVGIPKLDDDANNISTVLPMRSAVVANPSATPAVVARAAGKFAKIIASEYGAEYTMERLGEGDNHAGFKVVGKIIIHGKSAKVSKLLMDIRHRRISLIMEEKDGTRTLIHNILLMYHVINQPTRSYILTFDSVINDEPPTITSAIPL